MDKRECFGKYPNTVGFPCNLCADLSQCRGDNPTLLDRILNLGKEMDNLKKENEQLKQKITEMYEYWNDCRKCAYSPFELLESEGEG